MIINGKPNGAVVNTASNALCTTKYSQRGAPVSQTYCRVISSDVAAVDDTKPPIWFAGGDGFDVTVHRINIELETASALYTTILIQLWGAAPYDGTVLSPTNNGFKSFDLTAPQDPMFARCFSANPTTGNLTPRGTVACRRILPQNNNPVNHAITWTHRFDFRTLGETQGIVLRGPSQFMSVSVSPIAGTGSLVYRTSFLWSLRRTVG